MPKKKATKKTKTVYKKKKTQRSNPFILFPIKGASNLASALEKYTSKKPWDGDN